jgi:nitrogen regulatory protein P-II 1
MREVKAIIQPHMLAHVMERLHQLPHFPGVTVSDCQGQSRGRGQSGQFVPTEESIHFRKMTKLEIFCSDAASEEVVRTIQETAHTGHPGDGVVVAMEVGRIVRIRTGQEHEEAV